jgi:hypothetical protein
LALSFAGRVNPPRLQSLIVQLGSDNPQLRQDALSQLMDLKKRDLGALRAAALAQSPLLPGQIAAIRQAVSQVFLAAERYRVDPDAPGGFLGLRLKDVPANPSTEGIVVDDVAVERIPGFAAYRQIQRDDVIVQILDDPAVQLHGNDDLVQVVRRKWPGEVMHLKILRLGQPINVALVLDFLPVEVNAYNADSWIQDRDQKAEAYWNREFSVLEGGYTAVHGGDKTLCCGGKALRPATELCSTQASTDVPP